MHNLRDSIACVGIGETAYVRRSKKTVQENILEAVYRALDDAQLAPTDVDGIVSELHTPTHSFTHNELYTYLRAPVGFSAYTFTGQLGNTYAPVVAAAAITAGLASVVLTYCGLDTGSQSAWLRRQHGDLWPEKQQFEEPFGDFGQPTIIAPFHRRYMYESGITERQLGMVAVTQRQNAMQLPNAQLKKPMTIDDYLREPMIADPLRRSDICLLTDGAAATLWVSAERAKDFPHRPVYLMGGAMRTIPVPAATAFTQPAENEETLPGRAADAALAMAGVSLGDLDFLEVNDPFVSFGPMALEGMAICEKGEAGAFYEAGHASITGRLPVNTHGGSLSYGYLWGLNHQLEAVRQLRGEAGPVQVQHAEVGMVVAGSESEFGAIVLRR